MRVVVAHPSLNRAGGAERVCLSVIKALRWSGHEVTLATVDRTNWGFLQERLGELVKPDREICFMRRMPGGDAFSQALFTVGCFLPLLLDVKARSGFDVCVNTYGDLVDCVADVSYVNAVPVAVSYRFGESQHSPRSLFWRSLAQSYGVSLKVMEGFFGGGILLANSRFIQGILRQMLHRESVVVYPPVDLSRFGRAGKNVDRLDRVVAVARFRAGKHLEVIPELAKRVGMARFAVVGLADAASVGTVKMLREKIREVGVGDRVDLFVNLPFEGLVEVLSSSKVFLNAQRYEGFGMAIVEAMAAGCVPVVPRDGGQWYDVLDRKDGEYGFSYADVDEAAQKISRLLENKQLGIEVAARAAKRARDFDSSVFEKKIVKIVDHAFLHKSA